MVMTKPHTVSHILTPVPNPKAFHSFYTETEKPADITAYYANPFRELPALPTVWESTPLPGNREVISKLEATFHRFHLCILDPEGVDLESLGSLRAIMVRNHAIWMRVTD